MSNSTALPGVSNEQAACQQRQPGCNPTTTLLAAIAKLPILQGQMTLETTFQQRTRHHVRYSTTHCTYAAPLHLQEAVQSRQANLHKGVRPTPPKRPRTIRVLAGAHVPLCKWHAITAAAPTCSTIKPVVGSLNDSSVSHPAGAMAFTSLRAATSNKRRRKRCDVATGDYRSLTGVQGNSTPHSAQQQQRYSSGAGGRAVLQTDNLCSRKTTTHRASDAQHHPLKSTTCSHVCKGSPRQSLACNKRIRSTCQH